MRKLRTWLACAAMLLAPCVVAMPDDGMETDHENIVLSEDRSVSVYHWKMRTAPSAMTFMIELQPYRQLMYATFIHYDAQQQKRVLTQVGVPGQDNCDSPETQIGTGYINDQPVQFSVRCFYARNTQSHLIELSPISNKAQAFFVNALKTSTEPVRVRIAGHDFPVSTKGFNDYWEALPDSPL